MAQPIGIILQDLADFGVFFYILPFLLIFAIVFAILYKINIMGGTDRSANKGVYAVIAIAVALLSLQFDQVPIFFQVIFPKVGIALSILLSAIILMGLFVPDFSQRSGAAVIFFIIAAILSVIVLMTSLDDYSWWTGSWWQENISALVVGIIILVFVFIIIGSGRRRPHNQPPFLMQTWDTSNTSGRDE